MLSNVGNPSGLSGFFIMWNADGKPLECKWMCFQECGRQIVLIDVLSFFLLTFRFYSIFTFSILTWTFLPYSEWAFSGLLKDGGSQKGTPLPKICLTYPTVMKLGTVIPYLKKIQKIYESRDAPSEFCWHQHFSIGNQQILLYQEIRISIAF